MANPQPAHKSYFFDKGYRDLKNTVAGAWARNLDSIHRYMENMENVSDEEWPLRVLVCAVNILALVSVVLCGSAITALITLANILVLLVFMAVVYICFTVIWAVDRLYLVCNKIFAACPTCKTDSIIPHYRCPGCQTIHDNLTPGVYGILHRTCNCGHRLPTAFFNGRNALEARCPGCGEELLDRGARPFCVPVVGARSVGKTAFINAFSREFIENVAPENEIEIEFYSDEKKDVYQEIIRDFSSGSTRMTERPQDRNSISSVSFSFFAKNPALRPERLIHLYDVAGEVFTDNEENERQQQYRYCHGIVMIIDPFCIEAIREKYASQLAPEDLASIGKADLFGVADAFLNKLREVTGMGDRQISRVPLAVVISKNDSAGLKQEIGPEAVDALMREQPERFSDSFDAEDYLCRKLLLDNDMGSFINVLTMRFRKVRFFACSAIGHTRDRGAYTPYGVMPPMEWLCGNADKRLARLWSKHSFSDEPVAARENRQRINDV